MHFVLTYDLSAEGERRTDIENRIENTLAPYIHVKRLSTFYIIQVNGYVEWEAIRSSFTSIAQNISERFHFIMSPLMTGGRYNGYLPKEDWDEINKITNS